MKMLISSTMHLLFILPLLLLIGCGNVAPRTVLLPESTINYVVTTPKPQKIAAQPIKKQLPSITTEPLIAVLLSQGTNVTLSLLKTGVIVLDDQQINIPPGNISFTATGNGLKSSATGTQLLGEQLVITVSQAAGEATFKAKVSPPFGASQTLVLSGQPEIIIDPASRKAVLVERVGLETYLAGVLPTEISPAWPLEAIKAQSVVARSYTLDRYLTNFDKPWQLHWHFSVDMAYGGFNPLNKRMAIALKQTRGQLIIAHGFPVPAFFHASSGGKTENVANFRANLLAADGVTTMADVMPPVVDPYAVPGAASLKSTNKHINWEVELPMAKVQAGLQKWAKEHPQDMKPIGKIKSIAIYERFMDSNRVASVIIQHNIDGHDTESAISAVNFRLAVGPVQIRSTNWQKFILKPAHGGTLLLSGRGFGHGVGLSQISAYQMAKEGQKAGNIVKFFYPGSKLVQWWN